MVSFRAVIFIAVLLVVVVEGKERNRGEGGNRGKGGNRGERGNRGEGSRWSGYDRESKQARSHLIDVPDILNDLTHPLREHLDKIAGTDDSRVSALYDNENPGAWYDETDEDLIAEMACERDVWAYLTQEGSTIRTPAYSALGNAKTEVWHYCKWFIIAPEGKHIVLEFGPYTMMEFHSEWLVAYDLRTRNEDYPYYAWYYWYYNTYYYFYWFDGTPEMSYYNEEEDFAITDQRSDPFTVYLKTDRVNLVWDGGHMGQNGFRATWHAIDPAPMFGRQYDDL